MFKCLYIYGYIFYGYRYFYRKIDVYIRNKLVDIIKCYGNFEEEGKI